MGAPKSSKEPRAVEAARTKCQLLYAGERTAHRSCGIALAETFGRPTAPYQALRRGGITGCGECGAIVAGRLVLGEVFGDPDPTGAVTPTLRAAMTDYEGRWPSAIDRGDAEGGPRDVICNTLTGQFAEFRSAERHGFCTALATEVATAVAEVILAHGGALRTTPIDDVPDFDPTDP